MKAALANNSGAKSSVLFCCGEHETWDLPELLAGRRRSSHQLHEKRRNRTADVRRIRNVIG